MSRDLTAIFAELRSIIGEAKISIRIECVVLETVYIDATDDGRFLVSDHNYTYSYLGGNDHEDYLTFEEIGESRIAQFCNENNVELIDLHPDESERDCEKTMAIGTLATTNDDIRRAVQAVATCVDTIFRYAMDHK